MKAQAIDKIRTEMENNANEPYIQVIGEFLLQYIEANPQDAEKFLNDDKTIGKSLKDMRKVAEKKKKNNFAYLTPQEGFEIVLKYFGINNATLAPVSASTVTEPVKPKKFNVKLEDFL